MVRPLTKELQKKAIEKLREDPDRVEEDIQHIQEWIQQQLHLNAHTDKQWILGFLRGCKFNLQKAKEKLDMYYTLKSLIPALMKPRDIYSTEIQAILKAGMMLPLPYSANHVGPRVFLVRYHNLDTKIMNPENLASLMYKILTILMIEDDNFIISGVLLWIDISKLPVSFIAQFTPTFWRHYFACLEKGFPLRVKGLHTSGSIEMAEKLLAVVRKCLGPKLRNRIFIYSKDNFEDLFKVIPQNTMPKEYGGENSTVDEIKDNWITKVEGYSKWFTESHQYSTNEAMRPEKPVTLKDVVGIYGSFEELNNID